MNKQQIETLNVIQEVLRGMTLGLLAMQPERADRVADAIQAFAGARDVSPTASRMLENLAQGVALIASAGPPRN